MLVTGVDLNKYEAPFPWTTVVDPLGVIEQLYPVALEVMVYSGGGGQ